MTNPIKTNKGEDNSYVVLNKSNKYNSFLSLNYNRNFRKKYKSQIVGYFEDDSRGRKSPNNSFFSSFSFSKKINSITSNRGIHTPDQSQIYMRLKQHDKIAKIIKEESRKIYFSKRLNLGNNNLSAEELKFRIRNVIPQHAYKRQLKRKKKEKLKLKKNAFYSSKKLKNEFNLDKKINHLISTNNKLIRNFRAFSFDKELRLSRKNLSLVNNYFQKAEEQNKKISLLNKKFSFVDTFNKDNVESSDTKNPHLSQKLSNNKFKTLRSRLFLKKLKKIKEKSKVFDNIISEELNSNLEKIKSLKDDINTRNKIDYVSLTNKIFLSNLIKQMKIIYIKDPPMNILRGKDSKKISDIKKEVSLYDEFQGIYNKYSDDITFSRYNKIKLSSPKFIKTKFKKRTYIKYGRVYESHFGIPV